MASQQYPEWERVSARSLSLGASMKYEVMKGCIIDRVSRKKGDVIEVTEGVKVLLGMGRIIPASEPQIPVNRSVGLETSEDAPKRRGRQAKS
jgi:hypothetical protein|tara:strand:+ start:667 stop:942 length:276 start_codon:yes stop_codon:yes gene_type:complete